MPTDPMQHHTWDSSLDPEIVPLFLALQWAHRRSHETMKPVLLQHALSMAEFDVLATLRNAPPPHELTPKALQDAMVITSGGLTKVLLQLAARGLIKRSQRDADLRIKPACLSEAGKTLIETAMNDVLAASRRWLRERLTPPEMNQLTGLLRKIAD